MMMATTTATATSTTTTTRLTPSPSSWRHFVDILAIYRYVLLCLLFGSMTSIIGITLIMLAILFRTNTTSIRLIESIPLYMPGLILFCIGTSMVAFMNKNARRLYLLKSVGALYILATILLMIISWTTSTIHLPRLHSHRECAYNVRIRACTCVLVKSNNDDDQNPSSNGIVTSTQSGQSANYFIMEEILNCDLVHGIIFDSLRVVFTLSLLAIFVSISSIFTLYNLYVHEKHKRRLLNQILDRRPTAAAKSKIFSQDSSTLPRGKCSMIPIHNNDGVVVPIIIADETTTEITEEDGGGGKNGRTTTDPASTTTTMINVQSRQTKNNFKCLSVDFSSQDYLMLLDHQSVFNQYQPKPEDDVEEPSRIWSSTHSNFIDDGYGSGIRQTSLSKRSKLGEGEGQPESRSMAHQHQSNLRRYMSTIIDNVPKTVPTTTLMWWKKINLIGRRKPLNPRSETNNRLPPPHVIPRFSMIQVSSTMNNLKDDLDPKTTLKHAFQSSTSTSCYETSSSSKSTSSKSKPSSASSLSTSQRSSKLKPDDNVIIKRLENTANHQHANSDTVLETSSPSSLLSSSSSSPPSISLIPIQPEMDCLFNVEQACTDFTSNYGQNGEEDKQYSNVFNVTDNHQHQPETQQSWPRFECIDEDEGNLFDSLHMHIYPPSQEQHPSQPNYQQQFYFNPFEQPSQQSRPEVDHNKDPRPQSLTTFEEAFKNYYDSQNRISNNNSGGGTNQNTNYNTLPLFNHNSENNNGDRYHQEHHSFAFATQSSSSNGMHALKTTTIKPPDRSSSKSALVPTDSVQPNDDLIMEYATIPSDHGGAEEQIHNHFQQTIIEPPRDYQNNHLNHTGDCMVIMDDPVDGFGATNLLQSYQYWMEQLQNQQQPNDPITLTADTIGNHHGFINDDDDDDEDEELDDDEEDDDDDDDDDGAGDTSTSQDMADYELELDEEPIKFISEEEFMIKISAKQPLLLQQPPPPPQLEETVEDQFNNNNNDTVITKIPKPLVVADNNVVNLGTTLIEPKSMDYRKIEMNILKPKELLPAATHMDPDFGFDGFHKGFNMQESESSTASSSSLTDGTIGNDEDKPSTEEEEEDHSITAAGYIKPPTPFTNYLFES